VGSDPRAQDPGQLRSQIWGAGLGGYPRRVLRLLAAHRRSAAFVAASFAPCLRRRPTTQGAS